MAQPALDNGKKTSGQQRWEIRRVEATFVFSESGKAFASGSPSADAVLGCGGDASDWEALEALCREMKEKAAEVESEAKRMSAIGEKVVEPLRRTGRRFWVLWEVDPAAHGAEKLPVLAMALRRLRDNVGRHADKLFLKILNHAAGGWGI